MQAWGVDGCRPGWCYVGLAPGRVECGVVGPLASFVTDLPQGSTILIDIPIGLRNTRACDRAARRLLSPRRHCSVFSAPSRSVLTANDYVEALARNRAATGKGISKQAWNIAPKIAEVEALLTATRRGDIAIRESHPEVCFAGLAGHPMEHPKRTNRGAAERLAVLGRHLPHAREAIARAHRDRRAARDDVIDAAVLAYCALRIDECATLPEQPETDERGFPMEMVYLPMTQL